MKTITLLVPEQVNLASIDNPRRAFLAVNDLMVQLNKPPLFNVELCGLRKVVESYDGLFTVRVHKLLEEVDETDLIIIPAFDGDSDSFLSSNDKCISWLINHYHRGAEIASFCVGAFLVAATGLINGKTCSTHWRAVSDFMQKFPEVNLDVERIITDENSIYTSGGAFSSANLVLYIIEKYAGRQAAIFCSKIFQVEMDRDSQSPFIIFRGLKTHDDQQVKQAQDFIEKNYQEKISVSEVSAFVALSRRSLERRFKKATSNTLIRYIQRVKVEAAKKSFEMSPKNINEVMYEVGYMDTKSFRTVFRDITGLTPMQYRNRYNRIINYN